MEVDNLVSSSISNHDEERPMICLDAIGDKSRYTRIELFPHDIIDKYSTSMKRCKYS